MQAMPWRPDALNPEAFQTLSTTLNALADGVTLADADGRIIYSNTEADRILGVMATAAPAEEWASHYGVFLPDGETPFPAMDYPLVRALRGESTDNVEMVIRNAANQDPVLIAVTGRPVRDREGHITGAAVVFRDVTAARAAEADRLRTLATLQDALRVKDEVTGFLVHDLKSPLTAVLTLSELLLQDVRPNSNEAAMVEEILLSTRTLHRMVMNLLDIQIARDGRLEVESRVVPVDGLIEEVVSTMKSRARFSDMSIEVSRASPAPEFVGDAELTRRMLVNLVDNSIKFGSKGGRICIDWSGQVDGVVRIRVRDHGPGVPQELREAIFGNPAKVDRTGGLRAHGSHGLGLQFCKLAADVQEGRVWVEDNDPHGACFVVELPRPLSMTSGVRSRQAGV